MDLKQLAQAVGADAGHLSRIERGLVRRPAAHLAAQIEQVLDIAPGTFTYPQPDPAVSAALDLLVATFPNPTRAQRDTLSVVLARHGRHAKVAS
jgi:transcriptional regulator with XRE-family HTH domain